MRPQQLTALMTLGAAVVLALCLGISIATENYMLLAFVATVVVVGGLVIMPGYVPLFVFSLLVPFSLPVPFIWNFPFLMIGLGICAVKHWLQGGLRQRGLQDGRHAARLQSITISMAIFMVWVFLRYCMKPSFPNIMGWGTNVTGFRAWLNYALCFGVLFYTGRLIANRAGVLSFMRWLMYVSIFFIFIFIPATISGNQAVASFFFQVGMYIAPFDNGMLRFIALPSFGLFLLGVLLLPNLLQLSRAARCAVFVLGASAIVVGGGRTSLVMALIIVLVIQVLRAKYLQCIVVFTTSVAALAAIYFAGPALSKLPHTGFLRSFSLASPEIAEASGSDVSLEWREVRWQRGLEEIRKHPLVGVGYGGLENALVTDNLTEEDSQDIGLASGGVHNGYIACALALGIPGATLFVFILVSQILSNAARAIALRKSDPFLAELHCFVCANLMAIAAAAFFASDMNDPMIWFIFALGIFARQLRGQESRKSAAVPAFVQPVLAPA